MPAEPLRYALWMLLAGIGIPILAALNGQLRITFRGFFR